jgi:hypothetical protein
MLAVAAARYLEPHLVTPALRVVLVAGERGALTQQPLDQLAR